jgi:hypothetical protein
MVYVVERYLPGRCRLDLLPGLSKLERAIAELSDEGVVVRYLGSTVVLGDEACFCQFDGASEAAVAEANRRAGLPFDRIVPALVVDAHQGREEMSSSTHMSSTRARLVRSQFLVIVSVLAVVFAAAALATAAYAVGSGRSAAQHSSSATASPMSGVSPGARQYVLGIVSLTPAQVRAAFGTGPRSGRHSASESMTLAARRYVLGIVALTPAQVRAAFGTGPRSSRHSASESMTPQERRYVEAIVSMSRVEQAAAFGTGTRQRLALGH